MRWSPRHARFTLILFLLIFITGQVKDHISRPQYPDLTRFSEKWPPAGHLVDATAVKGKAMEVFPAGTTAAAAVREMGLTVDLLGSGHCLPRAGILTRGEYGWRIRPMSQRERWVWRIPMDIYNCQPEDLQRISGIGPSLAGKIYRFVQGRGTLHSLSELDDVPGVGKGKLKVLLKEVEIP